MPKLKFDAYQLKTNLTAMYTPKLAPNTKARIKINF